MNKSAATVPNTIIACRTTKDFQEKVQSYADMHDLTVSQMIRKGLKEVLNPEYQSPTKSSWSIKR